MLQQRKKEVVEKCHKLFERCKELYGMDLSQVGIRFDLSGRNAGQAWKRGNHYYMRFNTEMMTRESWNHIINETVPHEIAHIVCFMNPRKGSNHDYGWASVCRALGGSGRRCHNEDVVFGKGLTYEYTTTTGKKMRISQARHSKIQRGVVYNFVKGYGRIDRTSHFVIVGQNTAQHIDENTTTEPKHLGVFVPTPNTPKPVETPTLNMITGESKAAISRRIMLAGYHNNVPYETVIAQMMTANGYNRQLARATYKANAAKIGIPVM